MWSRWTAKNNKETYVRAIQNKTDLNAEKIEHVAKILKNKAKKTCNKLAPAESEICKTNK